MYISFPLIRSSIGNLTISPVMLSAQVADFSNYSLALERRSVNMTFDVKVCQALCVTMIHDISNFSL